jgi:hypothetical protein
VAVFSVPRERGALLAMGTLLSTTTAALTNLRCLWLYSILVGNRRAYAGSHKRTNLQPNGAAQQLGGSVMTFLGRIE